MGEENHVSVSFEMETRKTRNHQLLKELSNLISGRKYEDDSVEHFNKIRDFLLENTPDIYGISVNGRNCLHLIAKEPTRDSKILELFGLDDGTLRQYLTEAQVNELMTMKYGPQQRAPIHLAMEYGFTEFALQMLTFSPSLMLLQDGEGNNPLHVATMCSLPEATECIRAIVSLAEKENLTEDLIVNSRNKDGQTPIHTLCYKVPRNKDSQVTTRLELMLENPCSRELLVLRITDNSGKTPLHLLCSRTQSDPKYQNLIGLVKVLISVDHHHVNQQTDDNDRRTALHLACISEFVQIIEILAQHAEMDVTVNDAHNRMAIHYAAEKSRRPRAYQCVKILSDWPLLKSKMRTTHLEAEDHFREYLLWNCDCITGSQSKESQKKNNSKKRPTGNTVLTLACQAKSTKTVNLILRNLHMAKKDFDKWFIGKDLLPNIYSLKQVYKNTPEALEFLFDSSIRFDLEKSDEMRVEFTTDISIITALATPVLGGQSVSEMKYLSYAERWPENTREKLLLHPLTQCILFATWRRMSYYNILWFLVSIAWLIAYSNLIPYKYSEEEKAYPLSQYVAAVVLAFFTALYSVNELVEMIFLTSIVVSKPIIWGLYPPTWLEKYCAAAGVALSYFLFWSNIGLIYLPLGLHVQYLKQHFNQESFWSFTKVLVMMTGEFEYTSMFEENGGNSSDKTNATGNGIANKHSHLTLFNLAAFIIFLFIVPVAFYNLVTGLVVDKVKSLQSRIEMQQAYNHIRLIHYLQRTISKFGVVTSCNLSHQYDEDGEIKFDQQKCWYIERNAFPTWRNRIRNLSLFSCNFGVGGSSSSPFCGNVLPNKVKQKIFEMYEKRIALDAEMEIEC